jgi:HEAT repeat protein
VNLSRLIAYCESAEVTLQREVAEKLANEAVKPARQVQIVQYGGLKLLVPLTKSTDMEVQRLAAHALANLSVNCTCSVSACLPACLVGRAVCFNRGSGVADNQRLMADEDAIDCLITLLDSQSDLIQRQAAKALANLGVNNDNKAKIATAGGLVKLLDLAGSKLVSVRIEAVAAVANLAVNGTTAPCLSVSVSLCLCLCLTRVSLV